MRKVREKSDFRIVVESSRSLAELEQRLNGRLNHGQTIVSALENFVLPEWEKETYGKRLEALKKDYKSDELPTLKLKVNDVRYELHGIFHGVRGYNRFEPSQLLRDRISGIMGEFSKPAKRENYYYEHGFRTFFDLEESQEILDQEYAKDPQEFYKRIGWGEFIAFTAMALPLIPFFLIAGRVRMRIRDRKIKEFDQQREIHQFTYDKLVLKSMGDLSEQARSFAYQLATEMPQPLELEKDYILEAKKREKFQNAFFLKRIPFLCMNGAVTKTSRSFYTAEKLRDLSKRENLSTVHYLCGMKHVTEIAYFLQNPTFSMENLESYRENKK